MEAVNGPKRGRIAALEARIALLESELSLKKQQIEFLLHEMTDEQLWGYASLIGGQTVYRVWCVAEATEDRPPVAIPYERLPEEKRRLFEATAFMAVKKLCSELLEYLPQ